MPRQSKNARRRRPVRQNKSATTEVTKAIQTLQLVTQRIVPPERPDIMRMRLKRNTIHTFERSYSNPIVGSGIQQLTVALQDLPNYTDFSNLYGKLRYCQVIIEFPPQPPTALAGGALSTGYVSSSVIDNSGDSSPPGSEADLQQFDTYQRHPQPTDISAIPVTRVFTPRSVENTVTPTVRQWINMDNGGVAYTVGCVWVNAVQYMSVPVNINVIYHVIVQFMNPR